MTTSTKHVDNSLGQTPYVPADIKNQAYLAAGLAVLLLVELAGIGIYTYNKVNTLMQPENMADRVEALVRERYPDVRKEIVVQVKSRAPDVAKQVSNELLAAIPEARVDLELFAARQLARALDEGTELSAEQFAQILQTNRDQIKNVFETIESAPAEARRLVLETEAKIEQQLGADLQRQAQIVLRHLNDLNEKLARLAQPTTELSPTEQLERRIVRVIRTMQLSDEESASQTSGDAPPIKRVVVTKT